MIDSLGESRSFQTRHGSRVAIVGGGLLGTTLALRYRQAGRIVTVFESADRVERRGHASIASRDRALLTLIEELGLRPSVRWEAAHVNGLRFGAMAGGRARIVETLRDRARAIDVDVRVGTPVRAIFTDGAGFAVDTGNETGKFDQVVLTVPSPIAAQLVAALPNRERIGLDAVGYVGIINVAFVLKTAPTRPSGKRYVSRITRGGDKFAVLDPSALSPDEDSRPGLVYVSRPLAANHDLFEADDRRVIEHFARALSGSSEIVSARVVRMPHAFAQRHLPTFTSDIAGLSIVGAAHMEGGRHHLERTAALAVKAFRTLCAERIT